MENSLLRRRFGFQLTPSQALVLGFAALILIGTILLSLPVAHESGEPFSVVDALFTATSAVCVTGLVVVDTATQFSTFGEWVILLLIQAGGLGIMTLSALMFLLIGKRISLRERLLMQQALGSFSIAGVVRLTRSIIITTFVIELIGAVLLAAYWSFQMPPGRALYWGLFHAVSAFNNAGFDLTSASMRPFARDPFVLGVIALLFILGGLGFLVMEDIWRNRRWERLSLHSRLVLRLMALLLVGPTLLILAFEWSNPATLGGLPWYHKIVNAFFAAATPRTAGFESVRTGLMTDASLLLTIILMFIGANSGGTGGGIKTTTFSMVALTIRATALGRDEIQVMGRRLPRDLVDKAVAISAIAMGLIMTLTGVLLVTEVAALATPEISFLSVLFEAVSAFGTVGLSTGLTPELSLAGRLALTVVMFVGRVGPLTMAVALAQRKAQRAPIHYPEDRVMIG